MKARPKVEHSFQSAFGLHGESSVSAFGLSESLIHVRNDVTFESEDLNEVYECFET